MSITIKGLSYTYDAGSALELPALHDIDLEIANGEFVGIMGKTGCGKTTLIQLIAGLLKPSAGEILLDGEDINSRKYDRSILRRKVGLVFQFPEYQLFESTVEKDVAFGLKHSGLSEKEKRERVIDALDKVGFNYEKIRTMSPLGFSGGEKRRLAIAGVLAAKPEVLMLDEPVAGLDPLGRDDFMRLIGALNASGTTVLMVSHSTDTLAEYARRLLVLEDGRVLCDGPARQVLSDYSVLKEHGLNPGQAAVIAELLREKGFAVPAETVRYRELLRELKRLGKGAGE